MGGERWTWDKIKITAISTESTWNRIVISIDRKIAKEVELTLYNGDHGVWLKLLNRFKKWFTRLKY